MVKLKRPVYLSSLLLLLLLPFFDGGTNFLSEILILILPLPLFLLGISRKEFRWEKLPGELIVAYLFYLIFLGVSAISSASQIFSIPAFFNQLAIFLFFLFFLQTGRKEDRRFNLFWVMGIGVVLSLLSVWYLLPWTDKPASGMNLVYASYGHSHLAGYLALVLPAALLFFLDEEGGDRRLVFGALLIFFLLSLALTFSRGAFLVFAVIFFFLLRLKGELNREQKAIGLMTILAPALMLLLILGFSYSSWGQEAKRLAKDHWLVRQMVKPELPESRLAYWQQAAEGFLSRPLTGYGVGAFELVALRFQKKVAGWSNYAHNFYLQTLAEAGIFAFFAWLIFLYLIFQKLYRRWREKKDPWLLAVSVSLLTSVAYAAWDYDWHFPAIFLAFLFLAATALTTTSAGVNPIRSRIVNLIRSGIVKGTLLLSLLTFLFGVSQLASEWFYQKGDYLTALKLGPYPAVRVRSMGSKIFEKDFSTGEKLAGKIMALSPGDPSMAAWLGEKYFARGDFDQADKFYRLAIANNPLGNWRLYRRLEDEGVYRQFKDELGRIKISDPHNGLAKETYLIGLAYVQGGKSAEAIAWWRLATSFSPEWSYFAVELANLYWQIGKIGEAKGVLEECGKFDWPRVHCQTYLNSLEKGQPPETPGDYQERILQIPDY